MYELDGISWLIMFLRQKPPGRGRKQLVVLLNRLGHCENTMFTLELEMGLAHAIEKTSTLLSTSIVRDPDSKSVFHSEFDNFDQLFSSTT